MQNQKKIWSLLFYNIQRAPNSYGVVNYRIKLN